MKRSLWTVALVVALVLSLVLASTAQAQPPPDHQAVQRLEQAIKHIEKALEACEAGNLGKCEGQLKAAYASIKNDFPALAQALQEAVKKAVSEPMGAWRYNTMEVANDACYAVGLPAPFPGGGTS